MKRVLIVAGIVLHIFGISAWAQTLNCCVSRDWFAYTSGSEYGLPDSYLLVSQAGTLSCPGPDDLLTTSFQDGLVTLDGTVITETTVIDGLTPRTTRLEGYRQGISGYGNQLVAQNNTQTMTFGASNGHQVTIKTSEKYGYRWVFHVDQIENQLEGQIVWAFPHSTANGGYGLGVYTKEFLRLESANGFQYLFRPDPSADLFKFDTLIQTPIVRGGADVEYGFSLKMANTGEATNTSVVVSVPAGFENLEVFASTASWYPDYPPGHEYAEYFWHSCDGLVCPVGTMTASSNFHVFARADAPASVGVYNLSALVMSDRVDPVAWNNTIWFGTQVASYVAVTWLPLITNDIEGDPNWICNFVPSLPGVPPETSGAILGPKD